MPPLNATRRNGRPRWGTSILEDAKRFGITPQEAVSWHIVFRHDELVEYHRPQPSHVPDSVRQFVWHYVRQALEDLRAPKRDGIHYRPGADYWPDTEGAKAWFRREDDAPASFEWCCQVLGVNAQAVRERLKLTADRSPDAAARPYSAHSPVTGPRPGVQSA